MYLVNLKFEDPVTQLLGGDAKCSEASVKHFRLGFESCLHPVMSRPLNEQSTSRVKSALFLSAQNHLFLSHLVKKGKQPMTTLITY